MAVLGTKLRPLRPRRRLVQRARLTDRLRAGGGEAPRLVLVAAPAGFGKTTLLAQWLAAAESRVAWLALDPGDADLRQFLTDLAAAIQTVEPAAGGDALALRGGRRRRAHRRHPGQPDQRPRRARRSHGGGARRLPRHRRDR